MNTTDMTLFVNLPRSVHVIIMEIMGFVFRNGNLMFRDGIPLVITSLIGSHLNYDLELYANMIEYVPKITYCPITHMSTAYFRNFQGTTKSMIINAIEQTEHEDATMQYMILDEENEVNSGYVRLLHNNAIIHIPVV